MADVESKPPVKNLTGKEVGDFGKDVGKDIIKQTLVWTVASSLTNLIRSIFIKKKP